ncbi:MAG: hypothetical protein ACTFAL_05210 [Candidatus Electronema sp. V4]|uniref:hypothetical protein n=1 Tax=Candidatus Electronema sp. V4 TaxID=3454756 RepID=UPI004055627C
MKICPKCKQKADDGQCGACKIFFADYERQKQEQTGQIYRLISAGELEQAKELAQRLSNEFPDSKGEFILLISNINRDLNIVGKYRQAQELFSKGDYSETVLLLRNIRAFDPGLSEKVIALRRRAERHIGNSSKFEQAAALFEQKQYAAARTLLQQISSDDKQKKAADGYLAKIEGLKSSRLREIADCLDRSLFLAVREKLEALISLFPEVREEQAPLFALLAKRKDISGRLTAAAHKAKAEKRYLEAKVLYAFLLWQDQELRPSLQPYLEEIGRRTAVSLADCEEEDLAALAELGIIVDELGIPRPLPPEPEDNAAAGTLANIAPVLASPPPQADFSSGPMNIDGEEVADFTA